MYCSLGLFGVGLEIVFFVLGMISCEIFGFGVGGNVLMFVLLVSLNVIFLEWNGLFLLFVVFKVIFVGVGVGMLVMLFLFIMMKMLV